jgi:hypothetical protein
MRQDEAIRRGLDQRLWAPLPLGTDSVFAAAQLDRVEAIMGAVCAGFGCELIEFSGRGQHLHLLVTVPRRWRRPGCLYP